MSSSNPNLRLTAAQEKKWKEGKYPNLPMTAWHPDRPAAWPSPAEQFEALTLALEILDHKPNPREILGSEYGWMRTLANNGIRHQWLSRKQVAAVHEVAQLVARKGVTTSLTADK